MIPLESVKNIPIADVAQVLNIPLIRSGNTLHGKCPTGHESKNGNCFSVNISGNYFQCFSCRESGDVVKLVQIGKGLTFTDSLKWLADTFGIADDPNYQNGTTVQKAEWTPKAIEAKESDNPKWQSKALSFISYAERQLAESPEIMGYLTEGRFLSPDTVKHFRLGYNPKAVYTPCEDFGLSGDKVLIPKGIVIPYLSGNRVLRLRVRKEVGGYHVVRGSHTTPYQIDNGKSVWMIVESELDAFLVHQETSDMVNVAALGSASIRPDEALNEKLMKAGKIVCSMDFDEAGDKAFFGFWKKRYPNVSDFPVIEGKDPCEMVKAGIPIRDWVEAALLPDSAPVESADIPESVSSLSDEPENTAPSEPVRRTWCCGYLQGNCEFVIRETPSDCVMKCGHGGIIRNVWEMPDCPMKFWTRDSKGMPISQELR